MKIEKIKNKIGAVVSVGAGCVTCGGSVVAINGAPYFVVFINFGAMGIKGSKSLESYYEGQIHQKHVPLTRNGIQLWIVPYNGRYNTSYFGAL